MHYDANFDQPPDELWKRLSTLAIDDPAAAYPFSARLARENGWSPSYAQRVVNEYRRFLYLTQTAAHDVCPSEEVDQAWHLHLTYTRSYWERLCRSTLERPLHHEPTRGGPDEYDKHVAMYDRTLLAYQAAFGRAPPLDIWPPSAVRFGESLDRRRVNLCDHLVIPKPWRTRSRTNRSSTCMAALAAFAPIAAAVNPFDLSGPEFLALYCVLLVSVLGVAIFLRWQLRQHDITLTRTDLTPAEVACLVHNGFMAVNAAVCGLFESGSLTAVKSSDKRWWDRGGKSVRFVACRDASLHSSDLDRAIHSAAQSHDGATFAALQKAGLPETTRLRRELEHEGCWFEARDDVRHAMWIPFLLMQSVALVGAIKIAVGVARGKPVEFLILLCASAFIGSVFFLARPRLTLAASQLLKELRSKHAHLTSTSLWQTRCATGDIAMAASLFGIAAIGGDRFADVRNAWQDHFKKQGGSTKSGLNVGCGAVQMSSGCGGDGGGCGAGGCAGGCGGCGGGD